MLVRRIGEHLGREVQYSRASDLFGRMVPGALSCAVVLLWLSDDFTLDWLRPRLSSLVSAKPLVLFIAGAESERAFEVVLRHLDSVVPIPQIMTQFSADGLTDCVEQLLQATWPSEDHMDLWRSYLLVGADGFDSEALESSVAQLL